MLSLADFNEESACNEAQPMPFLDHNGNETGFVLLVLGGQAEQVRKAAAKELEKLRRIQTPAHGKGREPTIGEQREANLRGHASRIAGWSGVTDEYTPEAAYNLCLCNQRVWEQVVEFSENIGNFTKSKL